jgi:hypothetical protein
MPTDSARALSLREAPERRSGWQPGSGRLEEAIRLIRQLHDASSADPANQLSLVDPLFADAEANLEIYPVEALISSSRISPNELTPRERCPSPVRR